MIYAIRTTSGREDIVIDIMSSNVRTQNLPVKAIVHPAEIKGYVFAEGSSGAIHKAVQGLMHIRGIIEKPINLDEIKHFLELKKDRIRVEEGCVVEIIGGPFRGENGKVTRVDPVKDEVTIELMDASIPIPVTIATEFIKIIKRAAASSDADSAREEPKENIRVDPMIQTEPEKEEPEEEAKEAPAEEKSVFDIDEPETSEDKPKEEEPKTPAEESPKEAVEEPAEETKEPIEPTEPTETIPEAPEPEPEAIPETKPEPEPKPTPEPEPEVDEPEPVPEPQPQPETEQPTNEEPPQEPPTEEGTETEGTEEVKKKEKKDEESEE